MRGTPRPLTRFEMLSISSNTTLDLDARIRLLQRERFLLVTERQEAINWRPKMKCIERLTAVAAVMMLVGAVLGYAQSNDKGLQRFREIYKDSSRPIQRFQPATAPWLQRAWQRD